MEHEDTATSVELTEDEMDNSSLVPLLRRYWLALPASAPEPPPSTRDIRIEGPLELLTAVASVAVATVQANAIAVQDISMLISEEAVRTCLEIVSEVERSLNTRLEGEREAWRSWIADLGEVIEP